MALAFGLSPLEVERVADESPATFDAMIAAARDKWTSETELLAGIYELMHATYRLTAAAGGVKQSAIPEAVTVPRPARPGTGKKQRTTATAGEFRRWFTNHRGG
jgi:hypothetical protein